MEEKEKLQELIQHYQFNPGTAKAYLESKGKCVYCEKDLLDH